MRSMTGYGDKLIIQDGLEVFIQIKTFNHRFFEIDISSSEDIPWELERKIEDKIKEKISRGKVLVNLDIKRKNADSICIKPNLELAKSYLKAFKKLVEELNLEHKIQLSYFLNMPDVLQVEKKEQQIIKNVVEQGVEEVLKQVIEAREKEGKKHLESILTLIKKIRSYIDFIQEKAPLAQKQYREKIKKELEKILPQEKFPLISGQIASIVDKGNIEEEIVRFNYHLAQFNQVLQQKESIGKKLKFILQEMQREINTIGAKSLSAEISEKVVDIKDNIEKIREQIYNIE